MLDPEDELFDRKLANHLVSLYYKSSEQEEQEMLVSQPCLTAVWLYFTVVQLLLFLGRLLRVDLRVCPSVGTSIRLSVHKKFFRFQWNLVCR